MSENRDHKGQFVKGNKAAVKHGGEGALVKLRKGEPFDGVALAVYQSVLDELGVDLDRLTGIDCIRVKRAARFEAVARLFDGAALAAAAAGELDTWERYQQRGGWIGSKSFAAFGDIRSAVREDDGMIDAAIASLQEVDEDEPKNTD